MIIIILSYDLNITQHKTSVDGFGITMLKSAKANRQQTGNNSYVLCKAQCTYLFMLLQPFVLGKYLVIRGLYNEV